MKNRDYKIFSPGCYYHVYNRGNGKQDIFLDKEDFKLFLLRLRENLFPPQRVPLKEEVKKDLLLKESHTPYVRKTLPPESFCLLAYCLMPNHFHLLIKQLTDLPVSDLVSKVCTSYSMCFNKKQGHVGHVFQDRFKAVRIENDSQLLWTSAYIHQNPKVAGLVDNLEDYLWSSHPDYVGKRNGTLCDKNVILGMCRGSFKYKEIVEGSYDKIRERKDIENLFLD